LSIFTERLDRFFQNSIFLMAAVSAIGYDLGVFPLSIPILAITALGFMIMLNQIAIKDELGVYETDS